MEWLKKNWGEILLFSFLVLIPTQLGRHFWPEWSKVMGIRVDYLSPTLYLIDIIWVWWAINIIPKSYKDLKKIRLGKWGILGIVFVIINILVATNKGAAIYGWARAGQWLLTIYLIQRSKFKVQKYLKIIIPIWIAGESLLAVAQVINNGSLNGIWWWAGERKFDYLTIGVAQMSVLGRGIVRGYGTFSHPNSLAGFLLVGLILWSGLRNKRKTKNIWWWVVAWMGILGIGAAGSRLIWVIGGMVILISNFKPCLPVGRFQISNRRTLGRLLVGIGLMLIGLGIWGKNDLIGGWDSQSWSKRWDLNVEAAAMWRGNIWMGVGIGNFLSRLPEYRDRGGIFWLQPVHNIPLLLLSEIGLVGVIGLILKINIIKFIKVIRNNKTAIMITAVVAVTGLVDHYWVTLPQNIWLLAITIGLWKGGGLK